MEIREIVEDYELNFNGRSCLFITGYKGLEEFIVKFETLDLFHLLGIHKLKTGLYARTWLEQVKTGNFRLEEFYSNESFREVLPRIKNYDFFYEIFYRDKVKVCILDKDLSRNTMKLSVVFYKDKHRNVVILGLKRDKLGNFRPATLHESRGNRYSRNKKTLIKSIKWQ
ncbi:TPA: PBECR4 domain-containing protein [Streptococcus suis]